MSKLHTKIPHSGPEPGASAQSSGMVERHAVLLKLVQSPSAPITDPPHQPMNYSPIPAQVDSQPVRLVPSVKKATGSSQHQVHTLPEKLIERAALDHIRKYPGCSNASLARVLSFSVCGVEKLLRCLRNAGHLRQIGKGRARHFVFPVEHLTSGGSSSAGESLPKGEIRSGMAVLKRDLSTGDFIAERLICFQNCLEAGAYEHARRHVELARKRLELDAQFPAEEKAKLLADLKVQEDRGFAFGMGAMIADGLPAAEQRELGRRLSRASAEQLEAFRERVEAGAQLTTGAGLLALIGE